MTNGGDHGSKPKDTKQSDGQKTSKPLAGDKAIPPKAPKR